MPALVNKELALAFRSHSDEAFRFLQSASGRRNPRPTRTGHCGSNWNGSARCLAL